jgi:hypothetical protein
LASFNAVGAQFATLGAIIIGEHNSSSKFSRNAASAMMRRTWEKAKLVRPFTLCRR